MDTWKINWFAIAEGFTTFFLSFSFVFPFITTIFCYLFSKKEKKKKSDWGLQVFVNQRSKMVFFLTEITVCNIPIRFVETFLPSLNWCSRVVMVFAGKLGSCYASLAANFFFYGHWQICTPTKQNSNLLSRELKNLLVLGNWGHPVRWSIHNYSVGVQVCSSTCSWILLCMVQDLCTVARQPKILNHWLKTAILWTSNLIINVWFIIWRKKGQRLGCSDMFFFHVLLSFQMEVLEMI